MIETAKQNAGQQKEPIVETNTKKYTDTIINEDVDNKDKVITITELFETLKKEITDLNESDLLGGVISNINALDTALSFNLMDAKRNIRITDPRIDKIIEIDEQAQNLRERIYELNNMSKKQKENKSKKYESSNLNLQNEYQIKLNIPIKIATYIPTEIAERYLKEFEKLSSVFNISQYPLKEIKIEEIADGAFGRIATSLQKKESTLIIDERVYNRSASVVADQKSRCDRNNLQISSLYHEFAHLIFRDIRESRVATEDDINNFNDFVNNLGDGKFLDKLDDVYDRYKKELLDFADNQKRMDKIYLGWQSVYKGINEFFADAFMEGMLFTNEKYRSPYADEVVDLTKEYFSKNTILKSIFNKLINKLINYG